MACWARSPEKGDRRDYRQQSTKLHQRTLEKKKKKEASSLKEKKEATRGDKLRPPPPPPQKHNRQKLREGDDGMEHHYISLALNSAMMGGKECMAKSTIARITEARSLVTGGKIEELLGKRVDPHWKWEARPLKDDRYIIECPSASTTRKIKKEGQMTSLEFTLTFTPWMTDLYRPEKAEGALRWVIVQDLPMCFWDRDSIVTMLKPAGDLVQIGKRGCEPTEDIRVLLRVRKPRLLPSAIHCSVGTLQHKYTIVLDRGEPPLPWDPKQGTGQKENTATGGEANREAEERNHNSPKHTRVDKGKAPLSVLQGSPTRPRDERQRGILIRERPATSMIQRSEEAQQGPVHRHTDSPGLHGSSQQNPTAAVHGETASGANMTERQTGEVTVDGPGLTDSEKTGHVARDPVEEPGANIRHSREDPEEIDFEESIRRLTASREELAADDGGVADVQRGGDLSLAVVVRSWGASQRASGKRLSLEGETGLERLSPSLAAVVRSGLAVAVGQSMWRASGGVLCRSGELAAWAGRSGRAEVRR
ncbi:hypothetical protein J5N97_008214 [Dioscorea zingiberensis]|uniref:DUF4283 domain-containing protein n=1 Tax=Dioscorea zingiberensis TaxID=325984 RepID=A0A9D5DFI8_9LILI|nr:hypothetical protein J5N97_008214 [Dioscorea zingiberensis]